MKKLLTILLAAIGSLIPMETWAQDKAYEPYFNFNGDSLIMYSDTENAMIFYVMENFSSDTSEEVLYEIADNLDVNQNGTLYTEPILVVENVIIKAVAFRQGLEYSDPTVLIYDYSKWQMLLSAIEYGSNVYQQALNHPNIEQQQLEQLQWALEKGQHIYYERGMMPDSHEAEHFANEIKDIASEIEALMGQPGQNEAWFDGLTAYVMGGATLDDAFAQTGGRNEAAKTIAAIIWEGNTALTADMLQGINNPNLLVYVNEPSLAPQGIQNVVINGQAKEIILTDVTSGNNNFFCPEPFWVEKISYTRNFQQRSEIGVSRGWEGLALPFNVQTITHETHGELAPFAAGSNYAKPFWLRYYNGQMVESAHEIEAFVPYIIAMPNSNDYFPEYNQAGRVTFSAINTEVHETPDFSFMENEPNMQMMTIPTFQLKAKSDSIYAINVGQARGNYAEGSVFESGLREVRPFEIYTVHHGQGARPRFIPIPAQGNDATGIEDIMATEPADQSQWYDLSGRRLTTEPKTKGVYIQKGKKYVIK